MDAEKAYSFPLHSEWILWGNGSINCDRTTLFFSFFFLFKFFHKEITASRTHRPRYYSQTTHWEEMRWPQVCYIILLLLHPGSEEVIWMKFQKLSRGAHIISHKLGLMQFWKPKQHSKKGQIFFPVDCLLVLFLIYGTDFLFYCQVP